MTGGPAAPIDAAEFAALMAPLGPFEANPRIAAAVSGGADSLALAVLLHDWARPLGGHITALTVDHGLRPEAAAEARFVARTLEPLGLAHQTLRWRGAKPGANISAAARRARYDLLSRRCEQRGLLHLALGHHLDDQAETFLLRLGRGSGLDGLAAMAPIVELPGLRLLRPLLGLPKVRLEATLRARGLDWIEDPTNRDPAQARARLRQLLPGLALEGLTAARRARIARPGPGPDHRGGRRIWPAPGIPGAAVRPDFVGFDRRRDPRRLPCAAAPGLFAGGARGPQSAGGPARCRAAVAVGRPFRCRPRPGPGAP